MMGRQEKLFYSFNLEDHVPQNHLLRGIDRPVEWMQYPTAITGHNTGKDAEARVSFVHGRKTCKLGESCL